MKNITSMKQIVTEIWKRKDSMTGQDVIEIVNRESGKVEKYQKISEEIKPDFIAYPKVGEKVSEDAVDTEEYYGGSGFHRVRFAEAVIAEQSKIPTEDDI